MDGKQVVFTSLIETRGSTPQKAGAVMLVFEDGSQVGTLGGGCVEAEVKHKALLTLGTGRSELFSFQLDHDYGWDDGLICGGRMTMLVDPCIEAHQTFYQTLLECLQAGQGCTEAVALQANNAGELSRVLFDQTGQVVAVLDTTVVEKTVSENLRALKTRPRPYVVEGVSYLPSLPRCRLLIIGAGHVGRALAKYASDVDFDVTVIDDRETYCNRTNIPHAKDWIVGPFDDVLPALSIDHNTFCVVVTRGHNHDEEALFHLVNRSPRYLGMIGSKRKIRLIMDDLKQNGISDENLKKVQAPIGLNIGSQTVPEIAISIVAELIACRNLN